MYCHIDQTIELDTDTLPKSIVSIINEMQIFDQTDDWLNYYFKSEELESTAKSELLANRITRNTYDILMKKYGGYL